MSEAEDFKLDLVEEGAVTVFVLDQTEGLFLVHFVFFQLLDLVLLVLVEDVAFELGPVGKQCPVVGAPSEVRWHELVEVLDMHE